MGKFVQQKKIQYVEEPKVYQQPVSETFDLFATTKKSSPKKEMKAKPVPHIQKVEEVKIQK